MCCSSEAYFWPNIWFDFRFHIPVQGVSNSETLALQLDPRFFNWFFTIVMVQCRTSHFK